MSSSYRQVFVLRNPYEITADHNLKLFTFPSPYQYSGPVKYDKLRTQQSCYLNAQYNTSKISGMSPKSFSSLGLSPFSGSWLNAIKGY